MTFSSPTMKSYHLISPVMHVWLCHSTCWYNETLVNLIDKSNTGTHIFEQLQHCIFAPARLLQATDPLDWSVIVLIGHVMCAMLQLLKNVSSSIRFIYQTYLLQMDDWKRFPRHRFQTKDSQEPISSPCLECWYSDKCWPNLTTVVPYLYHC